MSTPSSSSAPAAGPLGSRPLVWLVAVLLVGGLPLHLAISQEIADSAADLARVMLEADKALQANELQIAESRFRTALLEGWLLRGALDIAKGDLIQAETAYERASTSAVENRRALTSLALVRMRLGEPEQAVVLLRRVVVRSPGDAKAGRLLAQALVAAGRPEEAVLELEEAVAAAPEDTEGTFVLATGYLKLGRAAEAEELFARVARERPIPQTQVLIGRMLRDFQEYERARAALESALEMDPRVRRAHYYLGTLELKARGRDGLAEAIAQFERELTIFPEDPMANLYLGLALAEERRFEDAIPPLEAAAHWPPTRLDALRFLGRCHLAMDRLARAVELFRRALELAESRGARPRQLSAIHYQLGGALRRQGAGAEATEHFEKAREFSTQLVETERNRFSRFLGQNRDLEANPEALTPIEATQLQGLSPVRRLQLRERVQAALTRAYMNLGIMQAQKARFPRAVDLFDAAAELDPAFPQLQFSLGAALFNAERFAEAVEALSLALEQGPPTAELRRMLALACLNTEAYDRAATLLADDPERETDPALQYAYAMALVRAGRTEEAESVFDRLTTENADWPELHVLLGQAHAQQGDFDSAVASLHRALELKEDVAEASFTLGIIYLKQGKLDEAERALQAELEHRPADLRSRYHLAVVLDLNRRPDDAEAQLRAVLRSKPDFADARYMLGKILVARGEAGQAAAHLEAAVSLAPEDVNIRYQLAQAYQRLGRRDLAGEQFAMYHELKQKQRGDSP